MFRRLYLKDKKFKCFTAATEEAIEALWEQLQKFGPPLGNDMKQQSLKKELKDRYKFYSMHRDILDLVKAVLHQRL